MSRTREEVIQVIEEWHWRLQELIKPGSKEALEYQRECEMIKSWVKEDFWA